MADENLSALQDDLYRGLESEAPELCGDGEGSAAERNTQLHALSRTLTRLIDGRYAFLKRHVRSEVERSKWYGGSVTTSSERAPQHFNQQIRRPDHLIPRPWPWEKY